MDGPLEPAQRLARRRLMCKPEIKPGSGTPNNCTRVGLYESRRINAAMLALDTCSVIAALQGVTQVLRLRCLLQPNKLISLLK